MSRRRGSRLLKQQLALPTAELGLPARVLLWAFRGEARSVGTIAVLFALSALIDHVSLATADLQRTIRGTIALLIFGVFLGVIAVTEDAREYRGSGTRVRMTCGAIAGAAVAGIFAAPIAGVVVAALGGMVLGYLGDAWVKHVF